VPETLPNQKPETQGSSSGQPSYVENSSPDAGTRHPIQKKTTIDASDLSVPLVSPVEWKRFDHEADGLQIASLTLSVKDGGF